MHEPLLGGACTSIERDCSWNLTLRVQRKGNELCRRERAVQCVDKCVNSLCVPARSREFCPPRPSFSPSVSLFPARSVFPGYRRRFPPPSLFSTTNPSPGAATARLSFTNNRTLARPTRAQNEVRRSRRRRRPLWRLDRLGIGCRTRSPGCRAAPPRCRPHPALDQACVSLSIFPFRAHATDGRVQTIVTSKRILTKVLPLSSPLNAYKPYTL